MIHNAYKSQLGACSGKSAVTIPWRGEAVMPQKSYTRARATVKSQMACGDLRCSLCRYAPQLLSWVPYLPEGSRSRSATMPTPVLFTRRIQ